MSIMQEITERINKMEPGKIISYNDFNLPGDKYLALVKVLSRLTKNNIITRISKGCYYKPVESVFGNLKPAEAQLIEQLTRQGKQITGYITGITSYNRMGLTSQVANELVIAANNIKREKEWAGIIVKFVKCPVKITSRNIDKLQILDAIRDIKNIPDNDADTVYRILVTKIRSLSDSDRQTLYKLALKYNPATRAVTGAIAEQIDGKDAAEELQKTLNPLTTYKIGITNKVLYNKDNWNIL